jgi:histidinol-phosphate aminotransferase
MHAIRSDVQTYNTRMLEAGIMVGRPFPPMLRYSRVSLGLRSEMEQWAETLRSFRSRGWV